MPVSGVLTVKIYVSPKAAIVAGKTAVGEMMLSITEQDLQALSVDLRVELADSYAQNEVIGKDPDEPPIIEATLEAVKPTLEFRAASRKKQEENRRIEEARKNEMAVVAAREATAKDNARSKALRAWVEKNGDDELKARMAEGYLREEEILDTICDDLLALIGFEPYETLRRGEACDCGCAGNVKFDIGPPRYLDAFQYQRLQAAREAAPTGATVTPIEHRASCPSCKCVPIARLEARVTMPWNGWLLIKQYSLT